MENYEFLSESNDPDRQFFLVQEDGSYVFNKGNGQFTTESIGDDGQPAVYDVSQCQFLVDNNAILATEATESVTFMIPSTSSNLYNNDVISQSDDANNVPDTLVEDVDSQNTNCTEITLSNEQYDLLQQNGWSLLETGDKVLMLDSSGLQDITNNLDLIQQLKAEIQSKTEPAVQLEKEQKVNPRSILKRNMSTNENAAAEVASENLETQGDTIKLVFNNDYAEVQTSKDVHIVKDSAVTNVADHHAAGPAALLRHLTARAAQTGSKVTPGHPAPKLPLKFKTQYYWKDIPEKIYLGRTVNGKNLVAKVKSIISTPNKTPQTTIIESRPKLSKPRKSRTIGEIETPPKQIAWRNASHLKHVMNKKQRHDEKARAENIFESALESSDSGTVTAEAAGAIAVQLMQTPSLLPMIGDANIVITKITTCGSTDTSLESSVLTGRMSTEGDCPQFIHMPNLLQDIMEKSSSLIAGTNDTNEVDEGELSVLQVHITQIKYAGQEDAIAITLHKRSLEPAKQKSLYECPKCPSVCKTADELTLHQEENHDMDIENILTIDTEHIRVEDDFGDDAIQIKKLSTRHGKLYQCLQCSLQFTRYNNCKKHVQAHKRIQVIIKDD